MAREFSVEEYSDDLGFRIVNTFVGFNRNFDVSQLWSVDQIALVKDENELLVFALDNIEALDSLRRYLIAYKPKAIMAGYFRKPKLRGYKAWSS